MAKSLSGFKVLVVEDSKVALRAVSSYIEELGIQPLLAENGADALELYRRERPDIVLLDIILPDIGGFDIAREIRKAQGVHEWTAIVFLSVLSRDEDLERGFEVGGDDYIMKPVSRVVVQTRLRAMCRLLSMQREQVRAIGQLTAANKELHRLSMIDGLTGVANRRMFDVALAREWRRCMRLKKPMAVVILDVDSFQQYNDRYGAELGYECLRVVAQEVVRSAQRAGDLVARYGESELAVILGETDAEGASLVARRICRHIAGLLMLHEDTSSGRVTVSCGVSGIMPGHDLSPQTLVDSADSALLQAKNKGCDSTIFQNYGQI
ncbi:MAG: diguanylate cyclase [Gallionella sp.]|nr:diguanylate cyclase [Gallionella sp.]